MNCNSENKTFSCSKRKSNIERVNQLTTFLFVFIHNFSSQVRIEFCTKMCCKINKALTCLKLTRSTVSDLVDKFQRCN